MQPFAPRLPGGLQQTLNNATTIGTPQMQPFQYNTAQQPEWFAQASQQMATQAAGAVFGNAATVKPPSEWDMGFGTGQAVEQAYSSALRMAGQSVFGGVPQQPNLSIAQQPFFNQPEQAAQRQGWADDATAQGYDWRTDPRYAGTDYSAAPEGSLRDRLEQQRQGDTRYGELASAGPRQFLADPLGSAALAAFPLAVGEALALGGGFAGAQAAGAGISTNVPFAAGALRTVGQMGAGMLGSAGVQAIPGFENLPSPIQSAARNAPYFIAGPGGAAMKAGGVGTTVLGGEISESLGAGRGTGEFVGGFAGAAPAALIRGGLGAVRSQIVSRKAGGILDTLAASTDEADLINRLKGMDPMDLMEVNEAVMRANPELAKELGRALAAARAGDMQAASTLKGALYGEATTLSKRVAEMTGEAPKSVRERAIGRVAKGLGGQKAGIIDEGQQSEALQQVEYLTQKVAQAKEDLATQRAIRDANRDAGKINPNASQALDYAEKQSKAFGMQLAAARRKAGLPSLSQLQEEARAAADLAKNGPAVVVTPEMRAARKGGSEIPVTQDPMAGGGKVPPAVRSASEFDDAKPGEVMEGFRGTPADKPQGASFGGSEGKGIYIADNEDLAGFFGDVKPITFQRPKKPLIVDEEPLYLLYEGFDASGKDIISGAIKKTDSEWTKLNKMAFHASQKELGRWDAEDVAERLTSLMKARGYDAVRVSSDGQKWTVLLDDSLAAPRSASRGTQAQAPVSAAPETPPVAQLADDIPTPPPAVKGLSGDKLPPPPTSGTQGALDGFGLPEKSGLGSIADNLKAIPGALKYVQTSGDIAGVQFRQGAPLGWIDPKAWGRSLNRVVRAYAEDPKAAGVMEEVQRIRRFADGELLDIVDPRTGRKIVIKPMSEVLETNFQVPGMEKINDSLVMRLAQAVPLSGRSEKAMRVGYLGMATDLRNSMIDDAIRAGINDQKLFNHYDDIAKLTVGYGDVPDKLRGLSDGFYSLRNIAARFQMVAAPFTRPGQVFKSPANMIKEKGVFSASPRGVSTRNLARFAAGEMANLALLSHAGRASGLFEVGWNPLEPGFGVAKYTDEKGNGFAHDLMGGWGSFVKMGTRSLAALNGDERFNAIDEQMQFWRNKAGPVPGMIIDTIVENSSLKDAKSLDSPFSKNPLDPETWTSGKALEYISPFFSGDAIQSLISGALDVTDPTDLLKVAGHLTANITTGTGNIYQATAYTKRDKYAEDTYGVPWEELNALEMARITARMADEGVDFPYKSARLAAYNDGAPQTAFDEIAKQYPILDGYDSMKEFRDENIAEGIKQGLTKNEAEKRVDAEINRLTIDTPAGPKNYEKLTQIIRMNVVERDRDIVNHLSDIPKYIEDYVNTLPPVEAARYDPGAQNFEPDVEGPPPTDQDYYRYQAVNSKRVGTALGAARLGSGDYVNTLGNEVPAPYGPAISMSNALPQTQRAIAATYWENQGFPNIAEVTRSVPARELTSEERKGAAGLAHWDMQSNALSEDLPFRMGNPNVAAHEGLHSFYFSLSAGDRAELERRAEALIAQRWSPAAAREMRENDPVHMINTLIELTSGSGTLPEDFLSYLRGLQPTRLGPQATRALP